MDQVEVEKAVNCYLQQCSESDLHGAVPLVTKIKLPYGKHIV